MPEDLVDGEELSCIEDRRKIQMNEIKIEDMSKAFYMFGKRYLIHRHHLFWRIPTDQRTQQLVLWACKPKQKKLLYVSLKAREVDAALSKIKLNYDWLKFNAEYPAEYPTDKSS